MSKNRRSSSAVLRLLGGHCWVVQNSSSRFCTLEVEGGGELRVDKKGNKIVKLKEKGNRMEKSVIQYCELIETKLERDMESFFFKLNQQINKAYIWYHYTIAQGLNSSLNFTRNHHTITKIYNF